jgi:hypothetical protein
MAVAPPGLTLRPQTIDRTAQQQSDRSGFGDTIMEQPEQATRPQGGMIRRWINRLLWHSPLLPQRSARSSVP